MLNANYYLLRMDITLLPLTKLALSIYTQGSLYISVYLFELSPVYLSVRQGVGVYQQGIKIVEICQKALEVATAQATRKYIRKCTLSYVYASLLQFFIAGSIYIYIHIYIRDCPKLT